MSSPKLSLFSYEILGLVGRTGAAPHDLVRLARRGRMLAWAGESQYYAEPKRLAELGYLDVRKEPGQTHERTVYTLTDKGLEALRAYAETPARFTPLKSDALLRLLIADLVGEDATRESLAALREDIADLATRLDDAETTAAALPHRRRYLLLVIGFLRRLLDLHLELVDDVERELAHSMHTRIRAARPEDRPVMEPFLERWHSLRVARRGVVEWPLEHPGLVAEDDSGLVGVLTYAIRGNECEVMTLHTDRQWSGVGSALLAEVEAIARRAGCTRLWLITTNDNVNALRFYQRRGFRLAALRPGAVDDSRAQLKPEIPEVGDHGIPLRDELELEREIGPGA